MTFGEILSNVYGRTGYSSSPASDVVTRIKASINGWQSKVLSAPDLSRLCDTTMTFASVASQADYAFGRAVAEIRRIYETTNDRLLEVRSQAWLRTIDPDQVEGTPSAYVPLGWRAILTRPSASTYLWAVSTQGADTGTVLVEGMTTDGVPVGPLTKALTGTTAVQISTGLKFTDVVVFALSAAQTGTISLMTDSLGGTTLATIPVGDTTARYLMVTLWPTPSAVLTYTADVRLRVPNLVQTYDEPLLPQDFHDILEEGAVADEYLKQDDARYAVAERTVAARIKELRSVVNNPPGTIVRPGSLAGTHRLSGPNLGGWYPRLP